VGTLAGAEGSEERLVELLVGARGTGAEASPPGAPAPASAVLLELDRVRAMDAHHQPVLDDCTLDVRGGEILGVAGVAGNGQRELAEVVVGTRPLAAGALRVRERDLTGAGVRERLLAGVAYVPEDGLRDGVLPHLSLAETFVLGPHHALFQHRLLFDEGRARALARAAIAEYGIAAPDESVPTARLSGGNIQKVLVARAMLLAELAHAAVLVAMNPTRGLDLATTQFVHRRLLAVRERGGAVLLASEDLDELLRLSDRIVVLYRGRITGHLERAQFDAYRIGALMAGAASAVGEESGRGA
jgi:ABC-type uncharacterized transport system ATPase subunit